MDAIVAKPPLTAGQLNAVASVPPHTGTDFPVFSGSVAANVYLDQPRFELERQRIFQSYPVPVTVSALLPKPKMMVTHDGYGVPLLLTRDGDGKVHAFMNVCQHRGMRLMEDKDAICKARIACPYHAWVYGTDGRVVGVPRSETFADLDKSKHSLVALPCLEAGGIIWVGIKRSAGIDFSTVTNELAPDLDAIGMQKMHLYKRQTFEVAANWKLIMDAFSEGYHVVRLHANTVAPFFVDSTNIIERIGKHIRKTSGRAGFEPGLTGKDYDAVKATIVFAYNVFPCAVIVTSPTYVSVMTLMPRAVNRTAIEYFMLTDTADNDERSAKRSKKSWDLMIATFGEDFHAAELEHEGIASGAIAELTLGGLERAIRDFHDIVDESLVA